MAELEGFPPGRLRKLPWERQRQQGQNRISYFVNVGFELTKRIKWTLHPRELGWGESRELCAQKVESVGWGQLGGSETERVATLAVASQEESYESPPGYQADPRERGLHTPDQHQGGSSGWTNSILDAADRSQAGS